MALHEQLKSTHRAIKNGHALGGCQRTHREVLVLGRAGAERRPSDRPSRGIRMLCSMLFLHLRAATLSRRQTIEGRTMIGGSRVQLTLVLCAFLVILNTGEMRGAVPCPERPR